MPYAILPRPLYTQGSYSFVSIREEDMLLIKKWRNEQMSVLRQAKPLSDESQLKYYRDVILPSFQESHPQQILFSFLQDGVCLGYGGLTHIDWPSSRAEVSFLLNTETTLDKARYEKEFSIFLSLLKKVAFDDLHLHRLFTETFDRRPDHIAILVKNGFVFEGRLRDHVKMDGEFVDSLLHGCLRSSDHGDRG